VQHDPLAASARSQHDCVREARVPHAALHAAFATARTVRAAQHPDEAGLRSQQVCADEAGRQVTQRAVDCDRPVVEQQAWLNVRTVRDPQADPQASAQALSQAVRQASAHVSLVSQPAVRDWEQSVAQASAHLSTQACTHFSMHASSQTPAHAAFRASRQLVSQASRQACLQSSSDAVRQLCVPEGRCTVLQGIATVRAAVRPAGNDSTTWQQLAASARLAATQDCTFAQST
jgi:hypothetical protein